MSELFLIVRLSKQLDQIFQLVDEFRNDTSYPIGVAVDECWIYTGDVAGTHCLCLVQNGVFHAFSDHLFFLIPEAGNVKFLRPFLIPTPITFCQGMAIRA